MSVDENAIGSGDERTRMWNKTLRGNSACYAKS